MWLHELSNYIALGGPIHTVFYMNAAPFNSVQPVLSFVVPMVSQADMLSSFVRLSIY